MQNTQNGVSKHQPETTRNRALVEPSWTYWYLLEQDKLHTMGNLDASHEEEIRESFIGFGIV